MQKLYILLFLIVSSAAIGQTTCDSLSILSVNIDAFNNNQLNVTINNENTVEIFSYPGFRVYDENDNLIGEEEVFFFGLSGESTHSIPFDPSLFAFEPGETYQLRVELWVNFYDSLVCEYDIEDIILPLPLDCVPVQINFIEFSEDQVSYTWSLCDYFGSEIQSENLVFTEDVGNITRNLCLDANCYYLKVVSSQQAEDSDMIVNLIADGNAGFISETLLDNQVENSMPFGIWTDCSLINSVIEFQDSKFEIYPNPAKDQLLIQNEINPNFNYRIMNLDGKTVLNGENDFQVDISNLSLGVYVIELITEEGLTQKKFIKQ